MPANNDLIEQTIPSLVNGVSRQPAQSRLDSQCEEQDNVISDVALGVIRRPPTEHITQLVGGGIPLPSPDGAHFSLINRGDGDQYLIVITEGDINVYDVATGLEVVVTATAPGAPGTYQGLQDLSGEDNAAVDIFETVTIADYTFVVNKTLALEMSTVTSDPRTYQHEFILDCKEGSTNGYTNIVELHIGDEFQRGDTTNPPDAERMCARLCFFATGTEDPDDTIGVGTGAFADFKFTRYSRSSVHGYQFQNLGTLHQIDSEDWYGNTLHELMATGIEGQTPMINKFSDAPAEGIAEFVIEVAGDEGNTEDSFFIKYDVERRTWIETVKPNQINEVNPATFPHVLIYNQSTQEFSYEQGPWGPRTVGDEYTAPEPEGIGKAPLDLFIHENRLALLLGENVLMSEAGDYFNFFPTTVTTLIDSDPIDIAGTGSRVAVWDYAVPVRRQVLLFSSIGDVVATLSGASDKTLSLDNAKIQVQGTWAHSKLRPQNLGNSVFYSHDKGGSSSVSELKEVELELWTSDEVTAHVSNYIPRDLVTANVGHAEQMIVYRSRLSDNELYIYGAETIGGKSVISSWSKWIFDPSDEILFSDWIESVLYIVVRRPDGVHLEKLDLGKKDEDLGAGATPLGHRVHIDSLISASGTYDVALDRTTWNLPYDPIANGGEYLIVRGGAWGSARGGVISQLVTGIADTMTATGDWSAFPVYIGREYLSNYQLSEIVKRDANGLGEINGRLQVRKGRVVFSETGSFDVVVSSVEDDNVATVSYTPTTIGGSLLGAVVPDDGRFQFYIGGRSEDVRVAFQSASFLPFKLSSFNWQGRYYKTPR